MKKNSTVTASLELPSFDERIDQARTWLAENQHVIKISAIANIIGCDPSAFSKFVKQTGSRVSLQEAQLVALETEINRIRSSK